MYSLQAYKVSKLILKNTVKFTASCSQSKDNRTFLVELQTFVVLVTVTVGLKSTGQLDLASALHGITSTSTRQRLLLLLLLLLRRQWRRGDLVRRLRLITLSDYYERTPAVVHLLRPATVDRSVSSTARAWRWVTAWRCCDQSWMEKLIIYNRPRSTAAAAFVSIFLKTSNEDRPVILLNGRFICRIRCDAMECIMHDESNSGASETKHLGIVQTHSVRQHSVRSSWNISPKHRPYDATLSARFLQKN